MNKPLIFTLHGQVRTQLRRIDVRWIEATARNPDWTEPDKADPRIERRFRAIDECGGRILRLACVETDSEIRVISVMFDRNARRKS
jgi:Domain of unknown function (DUF4258)